MALMLKSDLKTERRPGLPEHEAIRFGSFGLPRDCDPMGDLPNDVLLVEDNLIIAIDTEMMLSELGVGTVRSASRVSTALAEIEKSPPAFAVIDVNLGDGSGYQVASALIALDIPFVFATGYAELISPPPNLASARIITKPYTRDGLREALLRRD